MRVRLHVADDGRPRRCRMPCRGAVEHCQPSFVGEGLSDVRLGVTHQALELLTRRFDVGPVDRGRLPAPAAAMVGQPEGRPPVKMAARPVVTWSKRTGSSPSTSTAPAPQLPARPMLTSPSGAGPGRGGGGPRRSAGAPRTLRRPQRRWCRSGLRGQWGAPVDHTPRVAAPPRLRERWGRDEGAARESAIRLRPRPATSLRSNPRELGAWVLRAPRPRGGGKSLGGEGPRRPGRPGRAHLDASAGGERLPTVPRGVGRWPEWPAKARGW